MNSLYKKIESNQSHFGTLNFSLLWNIIFVWIYTHTKIIYIYADFLLE